MAHSPPIPSTIRPPQVIAAPPPTLHLGSPIATIAGVRFRWPHHCCWCLRPAGLFTDGGRIEAGLVLRPLHRGGPPLAQWLTRYLPAAAPDVPPMCPRADCDHPRTRVLPSGLRVPCGWLDSPQSICADPFELGHSHPAGRPHPVQPQVTGMLAQIWTHLRRTEPALALQANELSAGWRAHTARR